jgi:hypothetical protein
LGVTEYAEFRLQSLAGFPRGYEPHHRGLKIEKQRGAELPLGVFGGGKNVTADQVITPDTSELVNALLGRTNLTEAAASAFRRAYPDAPLAMIEPAVFHVFRDGIGAALEWVAAAERFLRDPGAGLDHGATWHVLYHLYNWQQLQALLPIGREGVLERLQDMKRFLSEGDSETVERLRKELEEMFGGDVQPPTIG